MLGDGGAAKAVKYVLKKLGIAYVSVVRKAIPGAILYEEITPEMMSDHLVVINTTPLGTFPAIEAAPAIPYHLLTAQHLAYDLVYNPEETEFLKRAKQRGAARAWSIWNS